MIPFILAALGGYFLGDSLSDKIKFEDGGDIPTNEDVLRNGDYVDSWMSEDGKNQDIIMEYNGNQYLIVTDAYGRNPKRANQKATSWAFKKGGQTK